MEEKRTVQLTFQDEEKNIHYIMVKPSDYDAFIESGTGDLKKYFPYLTKYDIEIIKKSI